jgi:oligopeptide/dipeptide ABC transporter ATP-binding protein
MSSAPVTGNGHHQSSGYLRLAGVSKRFGDTTVLNDLDLEIGEGEFISLIGPSGSGKTTTLRIIAGLETPTTGGVFVGNEEITSLLPNQRDFGMVFQHFALFPHLDVYQNVAYGLKIRGDKTAAIEAAVLPMLDRVGLRPLATRKIGELSGGQRQRVGIARALAGGPKLIVGDEPVSALDVSIQAQVLNLMMDLQKEMGLAYLFISHNLAVVEHISHRIAVMYLGRIVEYTDKRTLFTSPQHPYTESLLSAVPVPDPAIKRDKRVLQGDVPSPVNPPKGCHFHTRCPYVFDRCRVEPPALREVKPGQFAACHLR